MLDNKERWLNDAECIALADAQARAEMAAIRADTLATIHRGIMFLCFGAASLIAAASLWSL